MKYAVCFLAYIWIASPALADIDVRFAEGAPKDRFSFTNSADCALGPVDIVLELGGSKAGLIFDTTGSGAGVEVFQPFEVVSGAEQLIAQPVLNDGDTAARLSLRDMAPGQTVAFTIDVDDTMGGREITVSGSEILGASVTLEGQTTVRAAFDDRGAAVLPTPACRG